MVLRLASRGTFCPPLGLTANSPLEGIFAKMN